MILEDLRSLLAGQSSITSLLGSERQIYVQVIPQRATYPCLLISRISTNPHNTLDGGLGTDRAVDIDIEARANTAAAATALAEAVRDFLEPYRGPAGDSTIHAVHVTDEAEEHENPTGGSEQGRIITVTDYTVQYR
jgi:hypothetical protein